MHPHPKGEKVQDHRASTLDREPSLPALGGRARRGPVHCTLAHRLKLVEMSQYWGCFLGSIIDFFTFIGMTMSNRRTSQKAQIPQGLLLLSCQIRKHGSPVWRFLGAVCKCVCKGHEEAMALNKQVELQPRKVPLSHVFLGPMSSCC